MGRLEIKNGDVDTAISIMKEVADWGRSRGFDVWLDEWLTPEELVTEEAKEEYFCVGSIEGEHACSFILQWSDSLWWPDAKDNEAAYLHKFCVRRKFAHQGMTKQVIAYVKSVCIERGVKYIRLDTGNNKEVVKQIYMDAGFKLIKTAESDKGRTMALFEMEVTA